MVFAKYDIFINDTVELRLWEVAFFETPNFPELILCKSGLFLDIVMH